MKVTPIVMDDFLLIILTIPLTVLGNGPLQNL